MPILPTSTDNSTTTLFYYDATTAQQYDATQSSPSANTTEGGPNIFLIAIEVIFALIVAMILLFCSLAGIKRKERMKQENQCMIENAIHQQERRIQSHLQDQCHSNSTVTTIIQYPPPSYSPPDPSNQLSNETVARLDSLLLENQICSRGGGRGLLPLNTVAASNSVTLPIYSDLYHDSVVNRQSPSSN